MARTISVKWNPLKKGDVVDIVAPGFRCSKSDLNNGVKELKSWGLVPRVPKDIFGADYLCSNIDSIRAAHLIRALSARDSKAVWCLRGGYGAAPLMSEVIKASKSFRKKIFLGYSDHTTFHLFLNQNLGWNTLHSPVVQRLGVGPLLPKYKKELVDLVFGKINEITFKGLKPMNLAAKKNRKIRGSISGGNLTVAGASLAGEFQLQGRGKILFFEEIGERAYRIDRVLQSLRRAGVFDGCRAVIFAEFLACQESDGKDVWKKVLETFAKQHSFPVLSGIQAGHGKIQRPVPIGVVGELSLGAKGCLVCPTGAGF